MRECAPLRIGYVSEFNPFKDKKAWSGSIFKLREAIENAGFEVVWIPYHTNTLLIRTFLFCLRKCLHGNLVGYLYNPLYFKLIAGFLNKRTVDLQNCAYLFFPGGAQMIPYLNTKTPGIYYSDASFHAMLNYYWFNVHPWVLRYGEKCEYEAIHQSSINIRASEWAAESVINHYSANPDKVAVLPLGPTIDVKDLIPVKPYTSGKLRVLFSGVEWERKGGTIAVETVEILNKKGVDASLIIVGIKELPDKFKGHPFIKNLGFLDKNISTEYQQYIDTLRSCHILLLPTQAECAGIVFSEASALGLPIFTYDTGGISTYVENGKNGFRLSQHCKAIDFAESIVSVLQSDKMKELHTQGIDYYNRKLAWTNWSDNFKKLIIPENRTV